VRSALRVSAAIVAISLLVPVGAVQAITNGDYDWNDHPNVGIMYLASQPAVVFCSGSLIAPDVFLTAGHCTAGATAMGLSPEDILISFDEQLTLSPEGILSSANPIAVTGWETHPAFLYPPGGGVIHNDVGVFRLEEPVSDIDPVELPVVGFLDAESAKGALGGQSVVNVGYGWNSTDRSVLSPRATITWEPRRWVSEASILSLTPDHLRLAGGVCGGDSGGPHFYGGADSNLVVSLTSAGNPVCTANATQRLDTQAVLGWLGMFLD
jgi:V8-like Glu-specific endopeptidase